jgi:hypothetical protein
MSTAAQERVHLGHAFNPNAHLNAEKQRPSTFLVYICSAADRVGTHVRKALDDFLLLGDVPQN